jgi:hypothetical protein
MPAARPGGFVVVGEPYWRTWPLWQRDLLGWAIFVGRRR